METVKIALLIFLLTSLQLLTTDASCVTTQKSAEHSTTGKPSETTTPVTTVPLSTVKNLGVNVTATSVTATSVTPTNRFCIPENSTWNSTTALATSTVTENTKMSSSPQVPVNSASPYTKDNGTQGTQAPTTVTKSDSLNKTTISDLTKKLPGSEAENTDQDRVKDNKNTDHVGQQAGDKNLLWILLPVLALVGAAVVALLKSKCMKDHDHTEITDNGTENASFQSRPDNAKDGVMLLGVKSSGGEDNAAAR
ncbi:uncharacterized protein DDB_G0280205 isoform X4 [Oncorhynchus tshawytscha]|uniref:uncharacterized protein DDB_G0280205 isoform X4 n=1 Tax=Oncorhynchus tshawytscha TaxID=74940 RepID=UPI000D0A6A34|nr:uncharacterized protein DDB_G0280205 isoform X4 [Oncorhynchus tshawytscha]